MANETQRIQPWWKHWWGIILMIFGLLFVAAIIYYLSQFVRYYRQVSRGEISTADAAFLDHFTVSDRLRTQLRSTPITDVDVRDSRAPQMGNPTAPLSIVEFADFGCPWSREESFIIRELATKYQDHVSYTYRDFPVDELHPQARLAAEAGKCAAELGNFWAFHDALYQHQDRLGHDDLITYATQVGIDRAKFSACLDSGKFQAAVQADVDAGLRAGVRGTPTFFLNGKRIEGAIPRDIFEILIKAVVK